ERQGNGTPGPPGRPPACCQPELSVHPYGTNPEETDPVRCTLGRIWARAYRLLHPGGFRELLPAADAACAACGHGHPPSRHAPLHHRTGHRESLCPDLPAPLVVV